MAPNLILYEALVDTLPRSVKIICLWFVPNGYVKELTLFLPGLALLQFPRTKYLVAWLVFIRFVERVCHQWHTSAIPLKTSQPCDVIQEDLQIYTSQVNINGSTTLQLHHQLPSSFCWREKSRRMKTSTTMTHHGPRMNRISSHILFELAPILRVLGVFSYLMYPMCSCDCL
jgi:hypothetical protein